MNIDLHTHVKLSKTTEFSLDDFRDAIQEARFNGLDAMAMTEHFNTLRYHDILDSLDRHYHYRDDFYDIEGFKLFPGLEVDVKDGGHILAIGHRDAVRELRARLEPHTEKESFVELARLLDWCDELSMLRIGAHPHRESNPLTQHSPQLLRRLDAFDLNAKDLHAYGPDMRARVAETALSVGIPVVAGSDTHHPLQFGSICNKLDGDCSRVSELAACLREGRYRIEISACLDTKVKAAATVKKLLKKQAQLLAQDALIRKDCGMLS